ncbi:acyl carrier protein [Streptomyces sp. NPDC058683]|uniref:acyl carrier protein n=1 Tax=Streptomyces sp. NPDC058683 TaxID=3346597 RepID=UPI0036478C17
MEEEHGMGSEEVLGQLRQLCARVLSVPEEELVPQARLVADLEADSLDFAEMEAALEDVFGLKLDGDDTVTRAVTFGDVTDLVVARMTDRGAEVA